MALTLFGDLESGNVHKVQMILRRIGQPYTRVDAAQSRAEPRQPEFRAINPIGKVPTLLFDNGDMLSESGAILYYLGVDTELWPEDTRLQAEVLRWMFFEQYSHEPTIAVMRFLNHHSRNEANFDARIVELEPKAHAALTVMEQQLADNHWVATGGCTLADYALYPYTRVMDESGIAVEDYPAVQAWLSRLETQPNFLPMGADGAATTLSFAQYLANQKPAAR